MSVNVDGLEAEIPSRYLRNTKQLTYTLYAQPHVHCSSAKNAKSSKESVHRLPLRPTANIFRSGICDNSVGIATKLRAD
jgi:hypothetical protein